MIQTIKEYDEDNARPHHTYDRVIQFTSNEASMFPDVKLAYFCLIAACVERYSGRTAWTTVPYPANCLAYEPEDSFPPFMTLHIGHEEANEYRKAIGRYVSRGQWTDLTVDVYL